MSPLGPEKTRSRFLRLDEFSSFISCIKCFKKPIIPPLVTPSLRNKLKEIQTAAVRKETEKLRRKKELFNERQDIYISSKTYGDDCSSGLESNVPVQESCALWCPSAKDSQGRNSVAISKLPTSGIYSSVHTTAIVCSNVIENSHSYTAAATRDSLLSSGANPIDCVECSHNDIDPECSLCQEEFNERFCNNSFTNALNSEVPCRISLQQQDVCIVNEELNCTVEETDCESLPTVICNTKCAPHDTDSESYCISQSTDLDKYMEFSHELSSPDNSFLAWDSKSACQPFTLSRSDDASSETIVNTENELTPCASTLAELTDNIEDELSNADETSAISDRQAILGRLKRSHSMDSCMKLLQNCAKSMNVKKSLSEPLNACLKTTPDPAESKIPLSLKTSFLIKEDSKESEESKDIQEKDISDQGGDKILSKNDTNSDSQITNNSFEKKHIRQNSYTLDEPSTALILAHADCNCKMDADLSPHCSALKNENEVVFNSAFIKEKVEVGNPMSYQMKKIPILSPVNLCESIISNKENMTSAVIDVFPVVKEDSYEKSNSENAQVSEVLPNGTSASEINSNPKLDEEHLSEIFSKYANISGKNKDNLQLIYQDLQKRHEMQLMELLEQQKLYWLKLQEEFKEKERFLYEKIKLTLLGSPSNIDETDQINNRNYYESENTIENASTCEKDLSISNSTISSNQIPTYTSDNFSIQNLKLSVPIESSQLAHSQSNNSSLPQNTRDSVSPSRKCKTPDITPSKPFENIKGKQLDDSSSSICNFERNDDCTKSNSCKLLQNINGFASTTTLNFLHDSIPTQLTSAVTASSNKECDNVHTCVCDKSVKQFKGCTSLNECDISNSDPEYISTFQEQNSISNSNINSSTDLINSQTSLLTLCVQSKDFINGHDSNNYKNVLPISSQKSNDCNLTSLVFNSKELPSVDYDSNVLAQAFLKQNDRSVTTSPGEISLATKMLKNGSVAQHVTPIKRTMKEPILLKKFEKLPAFVKGYLTRRLYKTERMQQLFQTFKDVGMLIKKLEDDLTKKNNSISEEDLTFRRQLYIQLWGTYHDIHYILSETSVKERMAIIAESRNIRLRQKTLNQVQDSSPSVIAKAPESAPPKKHNVSSATLKYLAYKRSGKDTTRAPSKFHRSKSTIEMHICNIDGKDHCKERARTTISSKSLNVSPYANSVACKKRKTTSAKSFGLRHYLHQKQVPL